ncbi:MAG: BamA/TamA family outer membrane protein [Balneolaceae bacterium]
MHIFRRVYILLLFTFCITFQAFGQESSSQDSISFGFLPALSYNSDFGLILGGLGSRYHYKENSTPFYSYYNIAAVLSTKGLASIRLLTDKPNAFNKDIRVTNTLFLSRFFEDNYFGIGNYDKITDTPEGLPDFYNFQSFSVGFRNIVRFPLIKSETSKQLDINTIINLGYETPWDNDSDRLISSSQPLGVEGGRTFMVGVGMVWEGRNHEFRPSKGNYLETSFEIGQKFWGSSFNNSIFKFDARQYLSFFLIREITFANRILFNHTNGQTPYWQLSFAGDEETLRGFESKRFLDDNSIIYNTELRTWLFDIESIETKIGGTLFFDTGRTFPNGMSLSSVTSDLKYSFGFGGLVSLFTPDFIVRTDFGFSEEGLGVYFTSGFMF